MFFRKKECKHSLPSNSNSLEFLTIKAGNDQELSRPFHIKTFWQRITTWLFPNLKLSENLLIDYFKAKVQKEKSEAQKIEAQTNIARQKEVKEFNKAINEIFAEDGLPRAAKALKLAKVIEKNPFVVEQIKVVKEIIKSVELNKES